MVTKNIIIRALDALFLSNIVNSLLLKNYRFGRTCPGLLTGVYCIMLGLELLVNLLAK